MHVLLVEDNLMVGRPLSLLLEEAGYSVTWATNGQEALQAAAHNAFDLALIDLWLPDSTGFALAVRFDLHHDFPLIAMSAGALCPDALTGMGFVGWYDKVESFESLLHTIHQALPKRQRRPATPTAHSAEWGRKWL